MKELKDEYYISELISKDIVGLLSAEEEHFLNVWKNECKENLILYKTITSGVNNRSRLAYKSRIDVKSAWRNVDSHIKPRNKVIKLQEWMMRVAAVLVIGLFVSTLYYISTSDIFEAKQECSGINILPGSTKAVLQLQNGDLVHLEENQSDSIAEIDGTLISNRNGKVEYLAQNSVPNQLKPIINTIKIPLGGEYQLTLSDGTKVWLNSESEIRYPVNFIGNNRKVDVKGEVYFDVAHNKAKPFIVGVKDVEIEVLGTEFNVEAYEDKNSVVTTLIEGSVKLSKANETIIIEPNQQAIASSDDPKFKILEVDAKNYALWKDGIFYFDMASIEDIMHKLERWYDIKVFYTNSTVKTRRFSMEVKRYENIDKILDILSATNKVRFDIKGNVITVN